MIKQLTINELQSTITKAQIPILIIFQTKWCTACAADALKIAFYKKQNLVNFIIYSVDVDDNHLWREDKNPFYCIDVVPTYYVYFNQQIIFQSTDPINIGQLHKILTKINLTNKENA